MKIDIERIMAIDLSIRLKNTGTPDVLSRRLGISRRTLFDTLSYMKDTLKAPITYRKDKMSYVYNEDGVFCFTYQKDETGDIGKAIKQATKGISVLYSIWSVFVFDCAELLVHGIGL